MSTNRSTDVPHPGCRIKAEVIPTGMSVTKAADVIGVGRPALSNLLNGKAALSAEMATRLEKAFQYPLKDLMEMQAKYDAARAKLQNAAPGLMAYVPPFLAIKANDIDAWVSHNVLARTRLAVFLRTLVNSNGRGLSKVDFPGNDDAERRGWDGFVEAIEGTPWVPSGQSGWEFGTNEDPKSKADDDFEKRVNAYSTKKEFKDITFVFVTPRRWVGKDVWVRASKAKGLWKDVRAFDASDLEQWLEQSLSAQAWFANERHVPAQDVRSLDKCWADWADVATPPLSSVLFSSAIEAARRTVKSHLSKRPERPIQIAADSTEEALAFLSQLLNEHGGENLASYRDRVLVFDAPCVMPRLAMGAQTFIAVAHTREVEREFGQYANSMHSIVIYPRNAINITPDIVLEAADHETFTKALKDMGKGHDEISQLADISGRSLTVLRRHLSVVPAVQRPQWAADDQIAKTLVPFLLVGSWNSSNETDRCGLSLLADDRSYDKLERECQRLVRLNDAPIWSVGTYRGVISKFDMLYAIAHVLTPADLDRYFAMARMVLGEDDPALDLAEDKRWAASIFGKTREFSAAFREGISETLVLLAVHGRVLFKNRLGVDTEEEVIRVVRELLPTPLTTRILEANDQDLPTYAEAAPNEFLLILERDLQSAHPAVLGLMRPAYAGPFSRPIRTGLLWALEGLSWNPATLPRAACILVRLARVQINDNWTNKPMHSLEAIFRAWIPQTAANHRWRLDLMKKLAEEFPDIAWKLCIAQLGTHYQNGHYNHKPRWRSEGYSFGEPTSESTIEFMREMVEILLTRREYSLEMLCDLVECLHDLSEANQDRVWLLIDVWTKSKASDADKATVREKIRVSTLSRRAIIRASKSGMSKSLIKAGKAAYAALEPNDLLNKHAWLFRDARVEESVEEIKNIEEYDFRKRNERIRNLRTDVLREILRHRGIAGILELSARGNTSREIGDLIASNVLLVRELQELVRMALASILAAQGEVHTHKNIISGALCAVTDDHERDATLKTVASVLTEVEKVQLFLLAPFGRGTWKLVDTLKPAAQAKYWREVAPDWFQLKDSENNEAVERLLKAKRPRAAFSCIKREPSELDAQVLFRLLSEMTHAGNDQHGQYMPDHYDIERAFTHLNNSSALTLDQKASLEFAYIDVLARPWDREDNYGIPNLERYVEAHPDFFVQAIVWTWKRKDGAMDSAENQVPPECIETRAERGYELLKAIKRIPGHNELGVLEAARLKKWIATVRRESAARGRADIADKCIGRLLSHAPIGTDRVWPCEPVRDVMEDVQSELLMVGASIGVYNSRGAHFRGEGGNQERDLAEKYREWSEALQISHPFVAARLLIALANTYDREASREDAEAGIRRRLR
jgi:addiction module HigA family antidote